VLLSHRWLPISFLKDARLGPGIPCSLVRCNSPRLGRPLRIIRSDIRRFSFRLGLAWNLLLVTSVDRVLQLSGHL
jgi:hypothetical protein